MKFHKTDLEGVFVLEPTVFRDPRGQFLETYREEHLQKQDITLRFVQDNISVSEKGVVRGLHYQIREAAQAKLVMAVHGEILDVAVDLRRGSATFGQHVSTRLSGENRQMMLIPEGFAHGFSVLSEAATVYYKCSAYYNRDLERGLSWNDPALGIDWIVRDPVVSEKDRKQPALEEIHEKNLF